MKLWVDDERDPVQHNHDGWVWAKTCSEALEALRSGEVTHLSLDHDLGGTETVRPVVLWLCDNLAWPGFVKTHSMNPVGREWINQMIARYGHWNWENKNAGT